MSELRSCPFCGSGDIERNEACAICKTELTVRCRACGSRATFDWWQRREVSQSEVVDVWFAKEVLGDCLHCYEEVIYIPYMTGEMLKQALAKLEGKSDGDS